MWEREFGFHMLRACYIFSPMMSWCVHHFRSNPLITDINSPKQRASRPPTTVLVRAWLIKNSAFSGKIRREIRLFGCFFHRRCCCVRETGTANHVWLGLIFDRGGREKGEQGQNRHRHQYRTYDDGSCSFDFSDSLVTLSTKQRGKFSHFFSFR